VTVHTDPIMSMGESAASRLRTHNRKFACEGVKSLGFNNSLSILEAFFFLYIIQGSNPGRARGWPEYLPAVL